MKRFDDYPKSIKKSIRYIRQETMTIEELEDIQRFITHHIKVRKKQLEKEKSGDPHKPHSA